MKLLWIANRMNGALSVLILLLFSFSLSFPTFHSFYHFDEHHHAILACQVEGEEDFSHPYFLHLNSDYECNHQEHLLESMEECDLCASLVFSKTIPAFLNTLNALDENISKQSTSLLLGDISFYLFNEDVRGPPMVVFL